MSSKRTLILSITHKLGSDEEAEFNVGEAGQAFPDDLVAWRSITRAGKIASQPSELNAPGTGPTRLLSYLWVIESSTGRLPRECRSGCTFVCDAQVSASQQKTLTARVLIRDVTGMAHS